MSTDPTTTTEPKTRTITLTSRPPVTIREDDWPCIAEAYADIVRSAACDITSQASPAQVWHASSGLRRDARHITGWALRVRQHADGRAIVYGKMNYWAHLLSGENDRVWRGGELLAVGVTVEAIVAAIQRVGTSGEAPETLVQECIADLPAVEL